VSSFPFSCDLPTLKKVIAVLDWELCTLGNPWADLAYTCLAYHMPPELPSLQLAAPLPEGIPGEVTLLARYCAARGVAPPPPREWAFYLALSLFRLLSILAGVAARARQGNASSAAAAAISSGAVLAALTNTALAIIDRADAAAGQQGVSSAVAATRGIGSSSTRLPRPRPSLGAPSARAADLLARVTAFVREHVLPAEPALVAHAGGMDRWTIHPLTEQLKRKARDAGLWNLWLPAEMAARLGHLLEEVPPGERATLLGAGLSNLDYAHVCAAMGVSVWAPEVFNCSAPDTGNMEVLARWVRPAMGGRGVCGQA
jgi:acyl-CoA dehydrogenase